MNHIEGNFKWLSGILFEADDDDHNPECPISYNFKRGDGDHFLCSCGNLILNDANKRSHRNFTIKCDNCDKLASRATVCICARLEDYYYSQI